MTTEQQATFDRIRAFVLANEPESPVRESVSRTIGNYQFAVEGRKRGSGYVTVYEDTHCGLIACESPLHFVFDLCEVESALSAIPGDERELRDAARDPRIPLGPDDDGEAFEPMGDEAMRAAQNWHATRWESDPFETPEETIRRNWPNVFDGEPILTAMARGAEVRA